MPVQKVWKLIECIYIYIYIYVFVYLLFNGISIFSDKLIPKLSFLKDSDGAIEPIARRIWWFIPFSRVCLRVNVIARLEFELAYYDSAVQRLNDYTTTTHEKQLLYCQICNYPNHSIKTITTCQELQEK